MAGTSWDQVYSKAEASPLSRFRNKNRILKSFGPEGVRVYDELDGERTAREAQESSGVAPELFERILAQLISDGAVKTEGAGAGGRQVSMSSPGEASAAASSSSLPPSGWPSARAPGPSMLPPKEAAPPSGSRVPGPPPPSWAAPAGAPAPLASPSARRAPPQIRPSAPPEPSAFESSEERESGEGRRPSGSETPGGRPPSGPSGIEPSGRRAPPAGAPASSVRSSAQADASSAQPNLSPLEKLIFDKYGTLGLKVYELIDGERTAEDILNETGLSESKLVEILEFMNEQGIIKLDRPLRGPPSAGAPGPAPGGGYGGAPGGAARGPMGARGQPASDEGVGFKPMVESSGESDEAPLSPDALPVDVPVPPPRLSILQKAQMTAILSAKHGKIGHDLLSHIDGNKDFVQLSMETGLSLHDLDIILAELGKAGLLSFKPLTRTEVRHRYGDDGLAIYKRYGRDGLLIYQMIGKVESLREIVRRSQIAPDRAVDILIFVHRVLGLELPVDRDMIFRYLTKG